MARSQQTPPSSGDNGGPGNGRRASGNHRSSSSRHEEPVVTRRDMAGWVGGTPRPDTRGRWPGDRLGLAQAGPTSMAGWGRRAVAIVIDWSIAAVMSTVWFEGDPLVTLGIFALMQWLLLGLLGTTLGKRIAGIQIVRLGGAMTGLWKSLIRTVLLCVVVPPILIDGDGRGLHDRLAGTVEIRM